MQKLILYSTLLMVLFAIILTSISSKEESMKTIEIFHKNKKPSLQTLKKTKSVLDKYEDKYKISYYIITDSANVNLIKKYNLPETHFPFAIVINGKFSAIIRNQKIDFVHFPLFMQGIGRHEGNWSLKDLETALKDNSILHNENILLNPKNEENDDTPCLE